MYSVMIVDKRKQMYTIYRDMIPWQQYQFEIISYCDSESQAMEHFCEILSLPISGSASGMGSHC